MGSVLVRQGLRDSRTRTLAFAYVFAVYAWLQAAGYHSAYPTLAARLGFARTFAGNDAIRLFYGYPYDVVTVGGYCAWRVGGTLSIAAAAFGVLAAVRALRAEEDAGRAEMVLAGVVSRRTAFWSAAATGVAGAALLWLAELVGFVAGRLPLAGSAYLALATACVVPVFLGVGAVCSQLAASRRGALGLASGAVAVSWLLRVLGDTISGASWLKWITPLGWAELMRPFAGSRPAVLVLPVLASIALLGLAARLASTRDVGTGLIPSSDSRRPSMRMLSSPTTEALRREGGVLAVWAVCVASFAVILGMVSTSVSGAGISKNLQQEFAKFGSGSITSATGYLSFVFIFFVLASSLFVCSQVGAARAEEGAQHLETVLAQPVSRYRWLGGRLLTAAAATAVLAGLAGLCTWLGASAEGAHIGLVSMLEAGANCLPVSLLFLGVAALAYAVVPRASSAVSYSVVSAAVLWFLVGSLLDVPKWLVDVTPFARIGLVPAQPFRVTDALVMSGVGLLLCAGALVVFRRRDVVGD